MLKKIKTKIQNYIAKIKFIIICGFLVEEEKIKFIPLFNALLVRRIKGALEFISVKNFETRNESTAKLIKNADSLYPGLDFDWIIINTDDRTSNNSKWNKRKIIGYTTDKKEYRKTIPDFIFDNWKQTGISDYETVCDELERFASTDAQTSLLGWRGANTHSSREKLIEITKEQQCFDVAFIEWQDNSTGKKIAKNFISLSEQQKKWKYFIDVEGKGYSGRLKLLFWTGRIIFIQERMEHEWYYEYLKPWTHFVPVKKDFSDLITNYSIIEKDIELQSRIKNNGLKFAKKYLTRASAIERVSEALKNINND
jgi:hypothetical protein